MLIKVTHEQAIELTTHNVSWINCILKNNVELRRKVRRVCEWRKQRRLFCAGYDNSAALYCSLLFLSIILWSGRNINTVITFALLCSFLLNSPPPSHHISSSPSSGWLVIYSVLLFTQKPSPMFWIVLKDPLAQNCVYNGHNVCLR